MFALHSLEQQVLLFFLQSFTCYIYLVKRVHQRVQNSSAIYSEASLIESRKQPLFGVKNLPICFTTYNYFKKGHHP
jgi:hypothetical protein